MKFLQRCAILMVVVWCDRCIAATTAPSTQPLISFSTVTIPIELPSLSGRLFDQFQYSFHGQTTIIPQVHGDFPSAYQGPNSFASTSDLETSYTGTLFTGIRVLRGTEIYFDPEVSAGTGVGAVLGLGD